jgi:IS4 transposase
MNKQEGLLFAGRLLENRKLHAIREFDPGFKRFEHGELKQDAPVKLYRMEETVKKNGLPGRKQVPVDETFRIVRFRPEGKKEDILLITNILNMRAEIIAEMYRRRWDMEVFFRFLRQELNFSHFL